MEDDCADVSSMPCVAHRRGRSRADRHGKGQRGNGKSAVGAERQQKTESHCGRPKYSMQWMTHRLSCHITPSPGAETDTQDSGRTWTDRSKRGIAHEHARVTEYRTQAAIPYSNVRLLDVVTKKPVRVTFRCEISLKRGKEWPTVRQVLGRWDAGPCQRGKTSIQYDRPLPRGLFRVVHPSGLQRSHQIPSHHFSLFRYSE